MQAECLLGRETVKKRGESGPSVQEGVLPRTLARHRAPAQPQAAPPAPPPQLNRGDLYGVARAYSRGPDPVVALLDSGIVGFGA